jgi:hypothetical protein
MTWKDLDKIQNSKNRHCSECQIDIIDFTQMTDDEIIEYLAKHKEEKVCARMYAPNNNSRYSKAQTIILSWHEHIKSNVRNRHFKTVVLGVLGFMLFTSACIGKPSHSGPVCFEELVPDTSTEDPNDSTYVEVCY